MIVIGARRTHGQALGVAAWGLQGHTVSMCEPTARTVRPAAGGAIDVSLVAVVLFALALLLL
jgi:hypothetical protein